MRNRVGATGVSSETVKLVGATGVYSETVKLVVA